MLETRQLIKLAKARKQQSRIARQKARTATTATTTASSSADPLPARKRNEPPERSPGSAALMPPKEVQRTEGELVTEGGGAVSLPRSAAERPTINTNTTDAAGAAGGGMNDTD